MRRRAGIFGIVLVAALATGCTADGSAPDGGDSGPATLANVLGAGPLDADADTVRDALLGEMVRAGGVRVVVTGGQYATTVHLAPSSASPFRAARRFAWEAEGAEHVQLQLADGRVCVNRATGLAVEAWGDDATGWIQPSPRPYSCTDKDSSVGDLVIQGLLVLDPVTRFASLPGSPILTDLGVETGPDGVTTRRLQVQGSEAGGDGLDVPTTYDLWVDRDLRLVRAEFSGIDPQPGPYAATFSYGEAPDVGLPPASERGPLVYRPGVDAGSDEGPPTTAPE
ncbi:hypothetical protein GHK92_16230 [Nocardioides sp. dk4132]|uniref:hypothetical protein n=1 Tax=unclassified Nocardioides TaxID=2615069 RepID=UPI001297506D|nr:MULTISPECIES: hypothetical protein [unclassified Nocardioides]MQW77422.1 hypothetical protein [Nocardioides sp. dk4132]QGA09230.1 hypothetical protein GFH29_18915 [Nocardioides sp. dk884]